VIVNFTRVVFDHTNGPPSTRGLHIRRDGSTAAAPNACAYALVPTKGQQLTVVAEFTFDPPSGPPAPASIDIRAHAVSVQLGVLGDIGTQTVAVPSAGGPSGPIPFTLVAPKLHVKGVGKYDVKWNWQFRLSDSDSWVGFAQSDHVVYVTLDVPSAPWTQNTGVVPARRWPWTRVLDWACSRASGVKLTTAGIGAASKKVAEKLEGALHSLGDLGVLKYGNSGDFLEDTSGGIFKATKFVNLLEGNAVDIPTEMFCSECAVALTVLANCVGADLSLLRIQRAALPTKNIEVNRVIKIGESASTSPSFKFHEVAIRKASSASFRKVFDVCLQPDWDPNLNNNVHDFRLTKGRRLGTMLVYGAQTAYLQRLLEPKEELWADLKVVDRVMPCLDSCDGAGVSIDSNIDALQQQLRQQIDALSPPNPPQLFEPDVVPPVTIEGFRVYDEVQNPSHLAALGSLISRSAGFRYVSTVKRNNAKHSSDKRFRLSMAWSKTTDQAREALAWLMTRNAEPLTPLKVTGARKLGGVAFATPNQRTVYLVSGNSIARVASIGRTLVPTGRIAERVDAENERRGRVPPADRKLKG
jgi:hypothetical protein